MTNHSRLQQLLNAPDPNEAAAVAILVSVLMNSDTVALRAKYGHLPNSPQAELDWSKLQTDSLQNKQELIEKARAILQREDSR